MDLDRRAMVRLVASLPLALSGQRGGASVQNSFNVRVPLDHDEPGYGTLDLVCEWADPPRQGMRTVLLIADAQQFYLRPGGARRMADGLFGGSVNLLSIVGRSRAPQIEGMLRPGRKTDWSMAWRIFRARQWLGDIDKVLDHVGPFGKAGQLSMYGRSGGAFLIQQAVARRPDVASRLFLQAGVNHELDAQLGHHPDGFWRDLSRADPTLADKLLSCLRSHPHSRRQAIAIFQRQHFFVPAEHLVAARSAAARAVVEEDTETLARMRTDYQIDALDAMRETPEGIASVVRLAEFAMPHPDPRSSSVSIHPDTERLFDVAEPVLAVVDSRSRAEAASDWHRLSRFKGEALLLSARHDQTCDYRTQAHIGRLFRNSRVLLLNDNHVFSKLEAAGQLPLMVRGFLAGRGLADSAFLNSVKALQDSGLILAAGSQL